MIIKIKPNFISKIKTCLENKGVNRLSVRQISKKFGISEHTVNKINSYYKIRSKNVICTQDNITLLHELNSDTKISTNEIIKISGFTKNKYYELMERYKIVSNSKRLYFGVKKLMKENIYTTHGMAVKFHVSDKYIEELKIRIKNDERNEKFNLKYENMRVKRTNILESGISYNEFMATLKERICNTVFIPNSELFGNGKHYNGNFESELAKNIMTLYINSQHKDNDIANICKCSRQHVALVRKHFSAPPRRILNAMQIRDIYYSTDSDISIKELSEKFGVSETTVRNIINKYIIRR